MKYYTEGQVTKFEQDLRKEFDSQGQFKAELPEVEELSKHHAPIIEMLTAYLSQFPQQRFGQALSNLGINEFINPDNPEKGGYQLRDIYTDSNGRILDRMKSNLKK